MHLNILDNIVISFLKKSAAFARCGYRVFAKPRWQRTSPSRCSKTKGRRVNECWRVDAVMPLCASALKLERHPKVPLH
jgi:hypothetical protein